MAIYELRCHEGHRFEVIQSFTAPLPECPDCGAATGKIPSRFGVAGRASVPPPAEMMPQTWRGTHGADREYVTALRRTAEARRDLEQRHPELAGDRRPILAHEGRYENAPLRAGDRAPIGGPHGHDHGPGHGHVGGHAGGQEHGATAPAGGVVGEPPERGRPESA